MKKKNFLSPLLAVTAGVLLFSCAETDEDDRFSTRPLGFSTSVAETGATRATDVTTDNLRSMGVFASFTHGDFDAGSSKPDFMYNQKVSRTSSTATWTYSPVKYWPASDGDKLSFFAYAPYVDDGATGGSNPSFSGNAVSGYPTLTYTVPITEAGQIDLLASVPLMNQTYEGASGSLKFTMKHTLTKVNFNIKSEMKLKVTALSVNTAPATAALTFKAGGFSWGNYTGTQTFTATLVSGGTDVAANASDPQALATFFLLPDKANATLSITYLQDGETMSVSQTDVALPGSWTQEGSMSYLLQVKKDGLSVVATQSNEWAGDSSQDEAVTSKELAPGYKATDLKLGDYYYSDGTTSDGGYRKYADNTTAILNIMPELTDKDGNARSVVAIVFYVGKHSTDTDEYSATGIGTSTFHGYAVALRGVGSVAWCNKGGAYNVGTSTSFDDWRGFYNQQQIEAYAAANSADGWTMSNFPAANGCKNYTPAAPATSSGWFHPSSGQLKGLSGGTRDILNTIISKAKGNGMSSYYTWSSSEDSGDYNRAHHVPLSYGYNGGDVKTRGFEVRAILAF